MKSMFKTICLIIALGLLGAGSALAVAPNLTLVPPAAFDVTGYIQAATLDGTVGGLAGAAIPNADDRAGGTVTVNGIKMYVPNNTIVQMPAFALSWKQLFDPAFSAPVNSPNPPLPGANQATGAECGLALIDTIPPFPSFEIRAVGNIRYDLPGHVGQPIYIVGGLILPIGQEQLVAGFGIINYIYPSTDPIHPNRFRVGGIMGDPTTGAILEINDPVDDPPGSLKGRWGLTHSPDPRMTTDTGNPTVCAASGYPVGLPNSPQPNPDLPGFVDDPDRPIANRPVNPAVGAPGHDPWIVGGGFLKTFNMPAVASVVPGGPDPRLQVPLQVGDTVDYAGTLYKINPALPFTAANSYISVHTLGVDLGVFTAPGDQPCYVFVEGLTMPTAQIRNAPPVFAGTPRTSIALENTTRTALVGFTTDPTRFVDLKRIEVDPITGAETLVTFVSVLPEQIAPGLVRGRFVFREAKTTGIFPPTREYIVMSRTGQVVAANGLTSGQYRLPCFDFLFGERTVFGNPTVPNQFDTFPFLAQGCGPITGGPVFGRLDPWPGPNPPVTNP